MNKVEISQDTDVSTALSTDDVVVVADFEIEVIQETQQGPPGPQGPPGAPSTIAGPQGPKGDPGNTVLYGPVDPVNSDGQNGDFYINTTSHFMFGPKANDLWPAGTSLIGPQGPRGNAVLYGAGAPAAGTGIDGDFYINTSTNFLYGPKASGAWPAGTSLIGPQGPQGIQGIQGVTGTRGSQWYEGAGAPGTIAGAIANDNYLNTTNGDVYNYSGSSWGSPVGNIRGPQGIQGPVGPVPEAPTDSAYYTRRNGAWFDTGGAFVRFDAAQPALTAADRQQARANLNAAPFDSIAFNGMQFNGGFEVNQDPGANGTTTHATFFCDGWCLYNVGTAGPWARAIPGLSLYPGGAAFANVDINTGQAALGVNDGVGIFHVIEGYRMSRLALATANAMPMTLCFWSCHVRTGVYSGSLRSVVSGMAFVFEYTHAASNVWQFNVVQIPALTTGSPPNYQNNASLYLTFTAAAGSGLRGATGWIGATGVIASNNQINGVAANTDKFLIGGVALLPGNDSPRQDRAQLLLRPYMEELRIAQRYLEAGNWQLGTISGPILNRNTVWTIPYKVLKRTGPSITLPVQSLTRCTVSYGSLGLDALMIALQNTATGGDDFGGSGTWKADCRMN
ncbi:hypothetical protein [Bradyrhizobium zhanjiangense]|uniref:Collagen-like protein n=1 Tax=Bradyrhizobium zhanjiangense TaxID=1325107 RepID=A0ABY0DFY8_9BRAD|nr:hypothetical protein [Bradyrhizobium zhanjiangense]RXG91603.1 hypothetical protein EAS62_24295 [Bradyrhizobium zhanjiangense]